MNELTLETLVQKEAQLRLLKSQAATIADLQQTVLVLRSRVTSLEHEKENLRAEIEWKLWRRHVHRFKQSRLFKVMKWIAPPPVRRASKRLLRALLGR